MQAHTQRNHCCDPHQKSGADASEITYPDMSQNCSYEVETQTRRGNNAYQRPKDS